MTDCYGHRTPDRPLDPPEMAEWEMDKIREEHEERLDAEAHKVFDELMAGDLGDFPDSRAIDWYDLARVALKRAFDEMADDSISLRDFRVQVDDFCRQEADRRLA